MESGSLLPKCARPCDAALLLSPQHDGLQSRSVPEVVWKPSLHSLAAAVSRSRNGRRSSLDWTVEGVRPHMNLARSTTSCAPSPLPVSGTGAASVLHWS